MADASLYITVNGVVSLDTSNILSDVQNAWATAFGGSLSLDATTPQGRMIEIQTAERKLALDMASLVAGQINPNYATGQFLDADASIFGVERIGATNTIVYGEIAGVPQTVIAPGFRVKTSAGDVFETRQQITISANGSVAGVPFYAVETGAVPCSAGTLGTIVTTTPGVETVDNPAGPIYVGTDQESDYDFRKRMIASRYHATSLPGAVKSALNKINGVVDYWFYNNGEGSAVTVNSVTVDAHSIILVISGGADDEIADALFNTRSAGCGYTEIPGQSTTVNITDQSGAFSMTYPVIFNRPSAVPIDVEIQVLKNTYPGDETELVSAIEDALTAWAAGDVAKVDRPRIGGTVYTYEIGAAISDVIPEIIVQEILICATGGVPAASPISATGAEIVTLENINVTVNNS